jgi:stage V sporulation protein B
VTVLREVRCTPLLKILALSIPFGAIHACINGYYYGLQKTAIPAISQLLEQIARVGGVYILYAIAMSHGQTIQMELAVWGLFIGELVSVLFSASFTGFQKSYHKMCRAFRDITAMSTPLTANRVLINVMQSAEAILIPEKLREFGLTQEGALSVFGVLAGMALPIIFFPSALSNSVSVMLLPAIAEAKAKGDQQYIKNAVSKSCFYCLTLGFACTLGFLLFGKWLGVVIFANEFAGSLIMTLGWICPFLYLTTTLNSILNGLGKTSYTFLLNLFASTIRILFVWFLVPVFGIRAYLWGMLVSDLIIAGIAAGVLRKIVWK